MGHIYVLRVVSLRCATVANLPLIGPHAKVVSPPPRNAGTTGPHNRQAGNHDMTEDEIELTQHTAGAPIITSGAGIPAH